MRISIVCQKTPCLWRNHPELYGKHVTLIPDICEILTRNHIQVSVFDSVTEYLKGRQVADASKELVFPATENCFERNRAAILPSILEFFNVSYIGNDPYAFTVTTDKLLFQELCEATGLRCPPCVELYHDEDEKSIRDSLRGISYPMVLKYRYGTMSYKVALVNTFDELLAKTRTMLDQEPNTTVLCQEFIDGQEVAVPIVGTGEKARAIAAIEYTGPDKSCIKLYDERWKNELDNLVELVPLANPDVVQRLQDQCLLMYRKIGLKDFARFDLRVTDTGEIYFLEVNCLPNIGYESAFDPQAYGQSESFEDIILEIINSAWRRNRMKRK